MVIWFSIIPRFKQAKILSHVRFPLDNHSIGINSGPITAGVIRGDRPRLQIFGDTVNTAARIEATGQRGRIHLSDRTANILKESGYAEWVTLRKDIVAAKGKGRMTTYWLNQRPVVAPAVDLRSLQNNLHQDRVVRCIDWSSDLLLKLLKNIVAHRVALRGKHIPSANDPELKNKARTIGNGKLIVQEVANIIDLPDFDERAKLTNPDEVVLPSEVATQCRAYVAKLASKYHNNPFHNFEVRGLFCFCSDSCFFCSLALSDVQRGLFPSLFFT